MKMACTERLCGWAGPESMVLAAKDPFIEGERIFACPNCLRQTIVLGCDAPDCNQQATCGTPTRYGYRHTCYKHQP